MSAPSPSALRRRCGGIRPKYRLDVAGRSLAAVVGGFVLAGGFAVLLAALLAWGAQARGAAVITGTYLSWIVWTAAAMWAFYARSHVTVWLTLLVPGAVFWTTGWLIGIGG